MKGYKTLIWSLLLAVVGVLQAFDWTTVVPASAQGWVLIAIGAVTAALRYVTTTPVGKASG